MHPSFRLDEIVPVAPGTSPFHVRGIYYVRVVEAAKTLPGGMDQLLDELADRRVRDFMRQKFQFMGWYDALPTLPCGVAMTRVRKRPFEAYMRETGRAAMQKLIPSMFRIFSRLGGPRLAAVHAPRLFQTYFDFVELRLSRISDHDGSGVLAGIPLYAAPAIVNQVIGIVSGALDSLGATDIEASYGDVKVDGSSAGFEVVSCREDFKWLLAHKAPGLRV
jgi:hypothetical protein